MIHMRESISVAGQVAIISQALGVPGQVILDGIDDDTITTVGYAGQMIIDAIACVRVAQQYQSELSYKENVK